MDPVFKKPYLSPKISKKIQKTKKIFISKTQKYVSF
jgi:hypothetical protein